MLMLSCVDQAFQMEMLGQTVGVGVWWDKIHSVVCLLMYRAFSLTSSTVHVINQFAHLG